MRDAGVVDQDGDGAERLLGRVEGAVHGGAVEHVGLDGDGLAAGLLDLLLGRLQLVGAARHQRDRCAVRGEHLGEAQRQARRTRRSPARRGPEIEQFGGFHAHRPP